MPDVSRAGVSGRVFRDAVLRWGLKVYCQRCDSRGRFFRPDRNPELRLREVRCANILSDGESVCGGRLRAIPRTVTGKARHEWPRTPLTYSRPQGELFAPVRGDCDGG
jgi:hypothetical protein